MAKYAILSDIHSNYDALKVVLEKCRELEIDHYVSLGDIVARRQFPAVDPKFADRDAFPEYATCACVCQEE